MDGKLFKLPTNKEKEYSKDMKNKQKCKKMQKKTNNAKMNKVKKRMLIV
jgi:hypothetical protein